MHAMMRRRKYAYSQRASCKITAYPYVYAQALVNWLRRLSVLHQSRYCHGKISDMIYLLSGC